MTARARMAGRDARPLGWLLVVAGLLVAGVALARMAVAVSAAPPAAPLAGPAPGLLCSSLSFAPPLTYTTGTRPRGATTADFRRNGRVDLVVTNYSANSVAVLLGNGDGTFQPAATYAVGVHPVTPAVGDFNGDQIPDLAIANYDSASVSVLLGNGDGTFGPAASYSANIGPYGLTVGDFNGDGFQDLATSNVNFGTINILLGTGTGAFQAPVAYPAGLRPQVIASGDFNEDHIPDLVVPNYTASSISLFLGNGDGTFRAAMTTTVPAGPDFVTVADLNGDSHLDVILSHYATSNNITVLLGTGSGTFAAPVTYSTGAGSGDPTFVSVGDFNGDGIPDLTAPTYQGNTVAILPGHGDGTFAPAQTFAVPPGSYPVTALGGDFNGDGRLDLFAGDESTNDLTVLLSTCPQATTTPTPAAPSATATSAAPASATGTAVLPSATVAVPSSTVTTTPAAPSATATHPPVATATATPTAGRPTATATACPITFGDVHPADFFYVPVQYLYCRGVISGYGDNTFRPYRQTTRSQMVKIVVLGFALPVTTPAGGSHTFADVPPTFPFFAVVETAVARGVVSGYACGSPGEPCDAQRRPYFRPYANVTRGQLAKIDVTAAGWPAIAPPAPGTFEDVLPGSVFYAYVETATCHGIVSGYTCGGPGEPCDPAGRSYFRQGLAATRGQIAKIVYLSLGTTTCAARPAP